MWGHGTWDPRVYKPAGWPRGCGHAARPCTKAKAPTPRKQALTALRLRAAGPDAAEAATARPDRAEWGPGAAPGSQEAGRLEEAARPGKAAREPQWLDWPRGGPLGPSLSRLAASAGPAAEAGAPLPRPQVQATHPACAPALQV